MSSSNDHRATVLIVDDEPLNVELLCQELEFQGYLLETAENGEAALAICEERLPDLILLDIMMPGIDGLETCRRLKTEARTREVPVIFMTALSGLDDKMSAFEAGGVDYIAKPFQTEEVLARVGTHLRLRQALQELTLRNRQLEDEIERHNRARQTIDYLRDEIETGLGFSEIIGRSSALRAVLDQLEQVAPTRATVLIEGETGSGKELFARAIHDRSPRRDGPLIKLNCAALPRELVESELFGHEEGAFTGAGKTRKGRFELADGGTLFLDEVGELPPEAQAKLLRVLQEQEFERIGGTRPIKVDVRIVAATNRDLGEAAEKGDFRADLYFRLNVFPLRIPPLRERASDILLLATHFAQRSAAEYARPFSGFTERTADMLQNYPWPGNVRELQNIVERWVILARTPLIDVREPLGRRSAAHGETLEEVERAHIAHVLGEADGVIEGAGGAAARLGLNPSTLRARIRKLGIMRHS